MVKPIVEDKANVVYGSRFAVDGEHGVVYYWHYLGNKFLRECPINQFMRVFEPSAVSSRYVS